MIFVKRLKELDKHATPRPWVLNYKGEMYPNLFLDLDQEVGLTSVHDLHLIEYVRNTLPQLIERLEDADRMAEKYAEQDHIDDEDYCDYAKEYKEKWGEK